MRLDKAIIIFLCLLLVSSCSVTRRLSEGEYLLNRVDIGVTDRDSLARRERILSSELYNYTKQRPNKRFLGTNFYAWIYSAANPDKNGFLSRFARRIGEAPVIYDSLLSQRAARDMDIYMYGRGFLNASTEYSVDTAKRRANVKYSATQNRPYRIGSIEYDFRDDFVEHVVLEDTINSLIKSGMIFNITTLDQERERISDYLKEDGFYNFKVNNITYIADTTVGDRVVDVTMVVRRNIVGYDQSGGAILENNMVYKIRNVNLYPDFQPMEASIDNTGSNFAIVDNDTLHYEGINIISNGNDDFRPAVLRSVVSINAGDLYNQTQITNTSNAIRRLGYFKSVAVAFTDVTDTDGEDNFVSFVDADDTTSHYTKEGVLDCNIICTPGKSQSYSLDLEGTTTSTYYGAVATIGYQNRNIFNGFEQLDLSLQGGYDFMHNSSSGTENSFQIGATASITFPRLIAPYRYDLERDMNNVITRVEFSYDMQRRPYYHRALIGGAFGYQWSSRQYQSFVLRPIDISIIKLKYIDEDFLESLDNPYLVSSYESQFIAGLSASYIYNNSQGDTNLNSTKWRINGEINGNLMSLISNMVSEPYTSSEGETYSRLFGIRYAQYIRGDVNYAKSFELGKQTSLVYRFYLGAGLAYGNSDVMPFEKLFYCGGSNSMRGWQARTLGPGGSAEPTDVIYDSQVGDFKLETNLEARFPVWGMFKGAVFCDVGNVWYLKGSEYAEDEVFHFNNFYEQLGFNTGLGVRMDFNFFIFRVDWGIQMYNPNKSEGNRWINDFKFDNTTLNFGVGYPF